MGISRGIIREIATVEVTLEDEQGRRGHGEAVGIAYAGETPETMIADIEGIRDQLKCGIGRENLCKLLPYGGARNALDCALWDLESRVSLRSSWERAGIADFRPLRTAYTLGLMDETALREAAVDYGGFTTLKIKTDAVRGVDPVAIVREACPQARLLVDPNSSWSPGLLARWMPRLAELNVALLEQPVHPEESAAIASLATEIPIAADEAFTDTASIDALVGAYQVLNIKLDKTGGLTEALRAARYGQSLGFRLMIGCMAGSSLSMAPAMVVGQLCEFIDLDGPLLQADDCSFPIRYEGDLINLPDERLWR